MSYRITNFSFVQGQLYNDASQNTASITLSSSTSYGASPSIFYFNFRGLTMEEAQEKVNLLLEFLKKETSP